jgi:hypothetical protein
MIYVKGDRLGAVADELEALDDFASPRKAPISSRPSQRTDRSLRRAGPEGARVAMISSLPGSNAATGAFLKAAPVGFFDQECSTARPCQTR